VQVKVSRSGGVAGLVRRGVVELDDADLGAAGWAELVAAADQPARAGKTRDGFTWTIEAAGRRAIIPDRQLAGPLREIAQQALRTPDPGQR
jgi:hypothetical protein